MEFERKRCNTCGKYLIALKGDISPFFVHPDTPCSGTTDAIRIIAEVEDEPLQKIWEELYDHPKYSDHELLNIIWESKVLRWIIKLYLKIKKKEV